MRVFCAYMFWCVGMHMFRGLFMCVQACGNQRSMSRVFLSCSLFYKAGSLTYFSLPLSLCSSSFASFFPSFSSSLPPPSLALGIEPQNTVQGLYYWANTALVVLLAGGWMCAKGCFWRSEGGFWELVLSTTWGLGLRFIRLGGKHITDLVSSPAPSHFNAPPLDVVSKA